MAIGDGRPTEDLQAVQMSTNLEASIAVASFTLRACSAIHNGRFRKIFGKKQDVAMVAARQDAFRKGEGQLVWKPFVVEFTGVAGVGKTAVANKVCELLERRTNPSRVVLKHDRLSIMKALLSLRAFLEAIMGLRVLVNAGPRSLRRLMLQAKKWVRAHYKLWGCRYVPAIHLVDHGFFQTLRGMSGGNKRDIGWVGEQLFSHVARPDLVVVLLADEETISLRRRSREKVTPIVDPRGPKNAVSRMPEFARFIESTASRRGTQVLMLRNGPDDELGRVAEAICGRIMGMVNGTSGNCER